MEVKELVKEVFGEGRRVTVCAEIPNDVYLHILSIFDQASDPGASLEEFIGIAVMAGLQITE